MSRLPLRQQKYRFDYDTNNFAAQVDGRNSRQREKSGAVTKMIDDFAGNKPAHRSPDAVDGRNGTTAGDGSHCFCSGLVSLRSEPFSTPSPMTAPG
jgi:hypothetical protein